MQDVAQRTDTVDVLQPTYKRGGSSSTEGFWLGAYAIVT
jgi:hypothetical protein